MKAAANKWCEVAQQVNVQPTRIIWHAPPTLTSHSTTLRTGCMLFRHGTCTALLITGIWGWQRGWTKLNLVPLESSWGGVNRKSNYDVINRIHDFLFTCKVMSQYCKCLFHYAIQFGHWYWVSITCFLFFVVQCTWFVLIKQELNNAAAFVLPLPKIWPQSSNYLSTLFYFKFYKKNPTSGGWGIW